MTDHAPTPWQIGISLYPYVHFYGPSDKNGAALAVGACVTALGKDYDEANAAFIVKAVNNHDALVKALQDALCELSACAKQMICAEGGSVHRAQIAARGILAVVSTPQGSGK